MSERPPWSGFHLTGGFLRRYVSGPNRPWEHPEPCSIARTEVSGISFDRLRHLKSVPNRECESQCSLHKGVALLLLRTRIRRGRTEGNRGWIRTDVSRVVRIRVSPGERLS